MSIVYRQLGYSEVLCRYINEVSPHNILVTGVIDNNIKISDLKRAVAILQSNNPLLRSSIKLSASFNFVELVNSEITLDCVDDDPTKLTTKVEELIGQQLSYTDKPLVKIVLSKNKNKSTLMILAQHTVSDGVSLVSVYMELIKILDLIISDKSRESYIIKKIKPALENYIFEEDPVCIPKMESTSLDHDNKKINIISRWTGCAHVKLDESLSEKLVNSSKRDQVSVTAVISALLVKSLSAHIHSHDVDSISYNVMVNLRKFLSTTQLELVSDNDLGFYSGCLSLSLGNVRTKNLNSMVSICHADISQAIMDQRQFDMTKGYRDLIFNSNSIREFIDLIRVDKPSVGVSNMGVIESIKTVNFKLIDLHVACTCHSYSRTEDTFFVCVNSYENKIYLNFLYPMPVFTKSRMDGIVNTFIESVDDYC